MTQYVINIGAIPNDGTGDPLRTAFNETNLNFDQVFAAGPVLSNIQIANNKILTTNTNGNLVLAPNGTGVIQANVSVVPNLANLRNLGSALQRWNTVYTQYVDVSGPVSLSQLTVTGNLTVNGNIIQIGNLVTDAKTIQLANTASTANAADGSGITVGANDNIATMLYSSATNAWTFNIGVDTPNIVVNNITSDDSTFVTIQDGLDVQGDITAETLSVAGNIAGNYFIGNGSQLTGIASTYGNANVVTLLAGFGSNTVSTSGNITGGFIFGNISQANGFPTTYGNANVATFLANFGSNTISTTGNITSNGLVNVSRLSVNQTANAWRIEGNTILAPSGAFWNSNPEFQDEYITSAVDGYINLTSRYASGNTASQVHLEHGLAQIVVDNGTEYIWQFDSAGNLTLPLGGVVSEGASPSGLGNTIALTPSGGSDADQQLLVYPTGNVVEGNHLHLTTGNLLNTELYLGNDDFYVKLANTGNIIVNTAGNTAQWTFGTDGNLTFPRDVAGNTDPYLLIQGGPTPTIQSTDASLAGPANLAIVSNYLNLSGYNGNKIAFHADNGEIATDADMTLVTNTADTGNLRTWNFGTDGRLTFPGTPRIDTGSNNFEVQAAESINFEANAVVNIYTDTSGTTYQWQFGNDGLLTLPGGNVQIGSQYGAQAILATNEAFGVVSQGNVGYTVIQWIDDVGNANALSSITINGPGGNTGDIILTTGGIGANSNVWNFSTTGNLTLPSGGNLIVSGAIVGSGASPAPSLSGFSSVSAVTVSASGNVTATGNVTSGNVLTAGIVSATGNISGNYFIGNGSQLTGISSGVQSSVANGTSNVNIATANGNVTITANTVTYTFGTNSTLTLPGGSQISPLGANLDIIAGTGAYVNLTTSDESSRMGVDNGGGYVTTAGGTWDFDTTGNLTAPGNVSAVGNITSGNLTVGSGTITGGNVNGAVFNGNVAFGTGTVGGSGNITGGNLITTGSGGDITMSGGNITGVGNISAGNVSTTGNITAANFFGNGNTLSNVATQVTGSWTVPVGNNTQSFTVPINNTYQLWVNGNIPNGIIVYNATVSVSNTNVPVIGQQFAWNYEGGGNILMFTSIPAQIIGTAGAISNAQPAVANTNVFTFGINNTSGNTVTVNYGYTKIS
jgi:hypothetical protein